MIKENKMVMSNKNVKITDQTPNSNASKKKYIFS